MIVSILSSVKKALGLDASYTAFDEEIIMHINSTLSKLQQLGIGLETGFMIEDATPTWEDFMGTSPILNQVKTYVTLCVKLIFDPPPTSFAIEAMQGQVREAEYRISMNRELVEWVDPTPPTIPEEDFVLDGGYA